MTNQTLAIEKIESRDLNMKALHRRFWDSNRQTILAAIDQNGRKFGQLTIAYNAGGNVYCYFYIRDEENVYFAGIGRACGYGYCKRSAAAFEAMNNAGFTFNQHFAGAGMERVREALELVARRFANDQFLSIVEL